MNRLTPLALTIASLISIPASASLTNFFQDSTVDLKWKVNYYDIEGEGSGNIPVSRDELVALAPGLAPIYGLLPESIDAGIKNDMSINDFGTSAWINWRSGWLFDTVGVELEYQAAGIFDQSGEVTTDATATLPVIGPQTISMTNPNPYFYGSDAEETYAGKIGNANLRLKFGDPDAEVQFLVGRFTPTIYDLLHRPDEIYYGLHQVYEGASIQGNFEWSWGMIQPWFNYFTGYSNEWNEETVNFKDDLDDNYDGFWNGGYLKGGYDEIYNIGFHTVTDYYTSSASYSYAEDYLSNGIIEIYSGIPYSTIGLGDAQGDKDHYIKYMVKYGAEKGQGDLNKDHETDVWEAAIGLQHGNLDFLAGVTQIGDEQFIGFDTQDGMNAGGGTAVWGDVAILNQFDLAGQRTYFLVGGYNLTAFDLPKWRIQGVVANANDTNLDKLDLFTRIASPNEDYTEYNIDILYSDNGYQGDGMSYLLKLGKDDNFDAFGFGFFIEYNGDLAKLVK